MSPQTAKGDATQELAVPPIVDQHDLGSGAGRAPHAGEGRDP